MASRRTSTLQPGAGPATRGVGLGQWVWCPDDKHAWLPGRVSGRPYQNQIHCVGSILSLGLEAMVLESENGVSTLSHCRSWLQRRCTWTWKWRGRVASV
jgi:hypothetical protein